MSNLKLKYLGELSTLGIYFFIGIKLFLKEEIIEIENPINFSWNKVYSLILKKLSLNSDQVLKLNLIRSARNKLFFNLVYIEGSPFKPFLKSPYDGCFLKPGGKEDISSLIIPTGVGARFGGYAGDSNPLARGFSSTNDYLLANPNVVNGAVLTHPPENLIYLEGYSLNNFMLGQIKIQTNFENKIGVIFDKSINPKRLEYEINVLNACKAFFGANIAVYSITRKPLNIKIKTNKYGFSTGNVENIEELINSALELKKKGITSIAICAAIPDLDLNPDYVKGKGVDPIGGIESIISHIVSAYTGLVSAHAPVLISKEKVNYKNISPLSASEYISETFLPSVLNGLRYAPKIYLSNDKTKKLKSYNNISEVIVPYNAFGSPGVLFLSERLKNIYLIKENKTSLGVNPEHFSLTFKVKEKYLDLLKNADFNNLKITTNALKRPIKPVGLSN